MSNERPLIGIDPAVAAPQIVLHDYGNAQPPADFADIMRRLESPDGFEGHRLWVTAPREWRGLGPDKAWFDEPVSKMVARLLEWHPDYDEFGLPLPRPERIFWDWNHRRAPVAEHAGCAQPATPAHTCPDPDVSLFEKIEHCIEWSREQLRQGPPPSSWSQPLRWDEVRHRLPDVWELRARRRIRMPGKLAQLATEMDETEDWRWRQLYEQRPVAEPEQGDTR